MCWRRLSLSDSGEDGAPGLAEAPDRAIQAASLCDGSPAAGFGFFRLRHKEAAMIDSPIDPRADERRSVVRIDVNDSVRLRVDLTDSVGARGDIGVVCSKWYLPQEVCEVEFIDPYGGEAVRVLVEVDDLERDAD
jgi:hypothetical protein